MLVNQNEFTQPNFQLQEAIASDEVWEYHSQSSPVSTRNLAKSIVGTLNAPEDFPPLAAAIVPGDVVAVAIDPNVPNLEQIMIGIRDVVAATEASEIDFVFWGEADEQTLTVARETVGDSASVSVHEPASREKLRYLAADQEADPIYLARRLVDADFVLPVVVSRPSDRWLVSDLTGIYPMFADANTQRRVRHRNLDAVIGRSAAGMAETDDQQAREVPWLLGIQLMMTVDVSPDAQVLSVSAGTVEALEKKSSPLLRRPDDFPPAASLVVATIEGGAQQQSWLNITRALNAATRFAAPGATIVLWSDVDELPPGEFHLDDPKEELSSFEPTEEDPFEAWAGASNIDRLYAFAQQQFRLLLKANLSRTQIESLGLGCIESLAELRTLSQQFKSCGVLRGAQFRG